MLVFAPARPLVSLRTVVAAAAVVVAAVVAAATGAAPARSFWQPAGDLPKVRAQVATPPVAAHATTPVVPAAPAAPAPTPPMAAIVPGAFIWPVDGGVVTSSFGWRWGRPHEGIDIGADEGTPVRAVASGVVAIADEHPAYGRRVIIDHGAGGSTVYAHLSTLSVASGTPLRQGQLLGTVGCTGVCTGPHLHLESRVHGVAQNPRHYLR